MKRERTLLITVDVRMKRPHKELSSQDEASDLKELTESVGGEVVGEDICKREAIDSRFYIGEGKVAEFKEYCFHQDIGTVIFNNDLSPTQQRNLEEAIGVKVIDRTQLILDVFARHAKSPEGKTQVELAQLQYLLPRLAGRGNEFSRLGGGIGTRGPGEQKLEVDRRRIEDRLASLKNELKKLHDRRHILRMKRKEASLMTGALVGYTNAGKTSLLNALCHQSQETSSRMFTTLDPLSRSVKLPNGQKIIVSDTVGFLSHLPHHLIESFKSTLEEAVEAEFLIHVIDASHPRISQRYSAVMGVLKELGCADKKIVTVLNKIDLCPDKKFADFGQVPADGAIAISAKCGENLNGLLKTLEQTVSAFYLSVDLKIPLSHMGVLDRIYGKGRVVKIHYTDTHVVVRAEVSSALAAQLKEFSG